MATRWLLRVGLGENGTIVVEGPIDLKDDTIVLLAGAIQEVMTYHRAKNPPIQIATPDQIPVPTIVS